MEYHSAIKNNDFNKIRNEKGNIQQKLRKLKKSSDPTTNAYTQQNWKI